MRLMSNGRIRRTESEWRELLSRFDPERTSPREFCRKEKLRLSSFLRWRHRLEVASTSRDFVVVTKQAPAEAPGVTTWRFEVTLPDGRTLRMQG